MLKKATLKTYIFTLVSFIIIFSSYILPLPSGLSRDAMKVLGVFIGILFLWMTIGITWPSLLCLLLLGFIPTIGFDNVFLKGFGNMTFAFLLFTFMLTYALSQTSIIKRCVLFFVTNRLARKGPWFLATLFFVSVILFGSVLSPTALFFIFLPIIEELYKVMNLKKGDKFAKMLMIGLVTFTSLSSGMTPIAHVFPTIAMSTYTSITNNIIGYGQYMAFAIPAGIIIFLLVMLVFKFILKPDTSAIVNMDFEKLEEDKKQLGKITLSEVIILLVFAGVILLWVVPGIINIFSPATATIITKYKDAMPPLVGIIILSIIRIKDKPLLNFNDAITKGVSWPAMIMTVSTLVLSYAMTHVGLTDYLSSKVSGITNNMNLIALILLFVTWAAIQSNFSSHMVTATVVASLAIPIAVTSMGILNPAAIACVVGFVASIGSAAPSSMPYVASAGDSGWVERKTLLKYGMMVMLITIAVASFVAYPLANLVM